jgi:hypothetical protein
MPINQFLFDHQLAAMKADRAGSAEEREAAFEAMGERAERIANWRKRTASRIWVGRVTNVLPLLMRMDKASPGLAKTPANQTETTEKLGQGRSRPIT